MSELGLLAQQMSDAAIAGNARLDARFCAAMSNMDIETAMECFLDTSDLVVVLNGNVLRGPAAVRGCLTEMFRRSRTSHIQINEAVHWTVGETVFGVGRATCELEALDGTKSTVQECWTDARQRVAGRWVYILMHATQIAYCPKTGIR
jgi:ketosteroid isomerase-like protein